MLENVSLVLFGEIVIFLEFVVGVLNEFSSYASMYKFNLILME
jgi:hypothetical protein